MSSKQSGGVLGRVLDTVRPTPQPTYGCDVCGLSYDTERLNCPACGGSVDEQ
jgi:hypothetical protein